MQAKHPSPGDAGARFLICGLGGLGCPSAFALVSAGARRLVLCDDDRVDATNLHRQILFTPADVGRPKVDAAREALMKEADRMGRDLDVEVLNARLLPDTALQFVDAADVVVEGSDNFATKFLVADACRAKNKPVAHGAAIRWIGTALGVAAEGRPCYRCLFEDIPWENMPNCSSAGVMGPVVGITAAVLADLALGLSFGRADAPGVIVSIDGRSGGARRRTLAPRRGCGLCDAAGPVTLSAPGRYTPPACVSGDGI